MLAPLVKQDDFPSLGMAVKVKETKKDKQKKKQTMSLTDFMKSGAGSRQTDDNILMSLPTAPRARAPGEESAERGLGGGFREYGGQSECPAMPVLQPCCQGRAAAAQGPF